MGRGTRRRRRARHPVRLLSPGSSTHPRLGQARLARPDRLQRGHHRSLGRRQLPSEDRGLDRRAALHRRRPLAGRSRQRESVSGAPSGCCCRTWAASSGCWRSRRSRRCTDAASRSRSRSCLSIVSTWIVFRYMREFHDMYWMLPLMGFGQLSVLGAYAVYLPELFPTSLRSTGTSFCYNVGPHRRRDRAVHDEPVDALAGRRHRRIPNCRDLGQSRAVARDRGAAVDARNQGPAAARRLNVRSNDG